MNTDKKVFISYSWGNKELQNWVVELGTRLMNDTIDVVLDRWSLKEGHDIFAFMESMVNSEEIYRVLLICDRNYTQKADSRTGGVGTETQILTPEIYNNQKQEKFIPIVFEKDNDGNPFLPIFLSNRKYIDFSEEEYFESSYEELLRNILEKPSIPKPKLGIKPPLYITESKVNNTETNALVKVIERQLAKEPNKINFYSSEFFDTFLDKIWDFDLESNGKNSLILGKEIDENIKSFKYLREDYIKAILFLTKPELDLDIDLMIGFFEKRNLFFRTKDGINSKSSWGHENFKIIFHELFIYTIAICIKNRNYKLAEELLYSKYYFNDNNRRSAIAVKFTELFCWPEVLNICKVSQRCCQYFKPYGSFRLRLH